MRTLIVTSLIAATLVASCKKYGIGKNTTPEQDADKVCECLELAKQDDSHSAQCTEMREIIIEKYKGDRKSMGRFAARLGKTCIKPVHKKP